MSHHTLYKWYDFFSFMNRLKAQAIALLRWSERYTRTDMVYLASSGFWMNLGNIAVSIGSLLLYIAFANLLPKSAFGTYQYFLSAAAVISAISLGGMGQAVARATAQGNEGVFRYAVHTQIKWGIIPFIISASIAGYYLLQGNLFFGLAFLMIGTFAPINTALSSFTGFLQGKKAFRHLFFTTIVWNVPYYAALILALFLTDLPVILLAVSFVSQLAALSAIYISLVRSYRLNKVPDTQTTRYGKHLSVMGVLSIISAQADALLAFHLLGPVALATYSFASAVPDRLAGFFKFLSAAALPQYSKNSDSRIHLKSRKFLAAFVLILSLIVVYVLVAPYIFQLLFPQYMESIPYTQLYSISMLSIIGNILIAYLVARANIRNLYFYNIASPLIQIALLVIGILTLGLWGLVLAKVMSAFLLLIIAGLLVKREPVST